MYTLSAYSNTPVASVPYNTILGRCCIQSEFLHVAGRLHQTRLQLGMARVGRIDSD